MKLDYRTKEKLILAGWVLFWCVAPFILAVYLKVLQLFSMRLWP